MIGPLLKVTGLKKAYGAIQAVGGVSFEVMPGEIFVELGLAIKQQSPFAQTMVIELANDSVGYLPTRRAYEEGAYEPEASLFGPGVGEEIVEAALGLLEEARNPSTA